MLDALAKRFVFEYYAIQYSFNQALVSLKPTPSPSPEEMAARIRSAWKRKEITQSQVERDLGIHQSQFSKLVNGRFKEANGHAARLFEYSIQREGAGQREACAADAEALRSSLTERLMRAWDGTTEGARALEAILEGAARLRRRPTRRA
jgi:transcriptional regulator with XRE-family HTH domain